MLPRDFLVTISGRWGVLIGVLPALLLLSSQHARAAVTTVGAVPNAPPGGGGAVAGTFTIGDGAFGSVTVTAGTPITSTGGATLGNLVDGIGVVSLTGFGSNWTLNNAGSDLAIGDEGVGSISVANQALLTVPDDVILGGQPNSSGRLTVNGLGSVVEFGDDSFVGQSGSGIVEIQAGGRVQSDVLIVGVTETGRGLVTVTGDFSRWTAGVTTVGNVGDGRFEVLSGGRLSSTSATVGGTAGSFGAVEVSGVGSLWTLSSTLMVGQSGSGSIRVLEGGDVQTGDALTMGSNAAALGEVLIDGVGSTLRVAGALITQAGESRLTISNGALLDTTAPSNISSTSRVTLNGGRWQSVGAGASLGITTLGVIEGSGVLDSSLTVNANVAQAQRGRLQSGAADHLLVTGTLQNLGLVDLDGGEVEVLGAVTNNSDIDARFGATLRAGGSGLDNNGGSQLAITGGTVDVFGAVDNNVAAEIAVVGGATGVFHDTVTNSGVIFVSASSEIALLENLLFQPSSALSIGLAAGEFSHLDVLGDASMRGTLNVSLAQGYTPTVGDRFEILTAEGGVTGVFSTENLPALGGGLSMDVQYTGTSILLAVLGPAGIPGDYNSDGSVDAADYTVWRDNLGSATALPNDSTPGVAADDYDRWKSNFGSQAVTAAPPSAAVPEPAALALAVAVATVAVPRGRGRRDPR